MNARNHIKTRTARSSIPCLALGATAWLGGSGAAHAQCVATFAGEVQYPAAGDATNVGVADFNADGSPDIAVSNFNGSVGVLLNNGNGTFGAPVVYPTSAETCDLVVADMSGDGMADVVTANRAGHTLSVLRANGDGTFAQAINYSTGPFEPRSIAVGDLDSDGKLDVVAATWGGSSVYSILVFLGAGNGSLDSAIPFNVQRVDGCDHVSVVDYTNDGVLDVVFLSRMNTALELFEGDGSGGFAPSTAILGNVAKTCMVFGDLGGDGVQDYAVAGSVPGIPVIFSSRGGVQTSSSVTSMVIGDLTGDSRPDLALVSLNGSRVSVLPVGSIGAPGPERSTVLASRPRELALGDLNGDGRLDIVTANEGSTVSVLLNTTTGTPPVITRQPRSQLVHGFDVTFSVAAQFEGGTGAYQWRRNGVPVQNNDRVSGATTDTLVFNSPVPEDAGTYDVVAIGECSSTISAPAVLAVPVLSCNVSFASSPSPSMGPTPTSTAVADMNSDGLPDLIATSFAGEYVSIAMGTGSGVFAATTSYPLGGGPWGVAVGDLNNDGNPDLAIANHTTSRVTIMLSNNMGQLVVQHHFATGAGPLSIVMGDFNADGKQDLATANYVDNNVSVLLGNGNGTFAPATNLAAGEDPASVATGDLNGDGTLDLVVANGGASDISMFLGIGNGTFGPASTLAVGRAPNGIAIGDFNDDNLLDIVTADFLDNTVSVLLGTGNATFAPALRYGSGLSPRHVTAADLNGDRRLDLAVCNFNGNDITVLKGHGNGAFTTSGSPAGTNPVASTVADLNGDGRPDLVAANMSSNDLSVLFSDGPSTGFSQQPQDQSVSEGASATFTVTPIGAGPFTYQWRRDGLPISGAASGTFMISNVTAANVASYDVEVRGGCNLASIATSYPAVLTIAGNPCIADANHDSFVNSQDFFLFLASFFNGCP